MSGIMGFWIARRMKENGVDRPFRRTRPKMPSAPWRLAAITCFAVGAVITWLVVRDGDDAAIVAVRTIFGGAVAFVVGMLVVERMWEHRDRRRRETPHTPIGRRR